MTQLLVADSSTFEDPVELDPELLEGQEPDDEDRDAVVAGVSAWGISIVVHVIALLLLVFVVFLDRMQPEKAPIRVVQIEAPPVVEEEEKERDLIEKVVTEIEAEEEVENPMVTELDLPVEEIETEDEEVSEVPAKGREEAVASSETGGAGAFMAIGAGGGAAGAFGNRNGGGRKRAVGRYGGSKASESAVEAALRWFARHQSGNGMWDLDAYPLNCTLEGPKCEPGTLDNSVVIGGSDNKQHTADVAMTGYAILCFLGAGYDHRTPNKWRKTVRGGIDWLLSIQTRDGVFGQSNYEHGIATMAIAEALGMTNDPKLRAPATKAVAAILARQALHGSSGYAWDYWKANPARNDSSVSGWCIMALKSAKAAGLNTGNGLPGAKQWLETTWRASNPNWKSIDAYGTSGFPYTWDATTGKVTKDKNGPEDMTCVGALCAVFLGYRGDSPMLASLANNLRKNQFQKQWPLETYYVYYSTLAMFQVGGDGWKEWNSVVRDLLVNNQRQSQDCFDGSWDIGTRTSKQWGQRMLATAYCCLSLEVYYRYLPVAVKH
ncbi:MAG: terpene cyclase/mutase family protein [Planctomycetota bacterium]|jgi:hypothetical protein|nr:terpene cyclase/mutase family protein [Planctomycetota bacterium]